MAARSITVGAYIPNVVDLRETLQTIHEEEGIDFAVVPLFHPTFERSPSTESQHSWQLLPQTRSDLLLPSQDWTNYVVGKLSDFVRPESTKPSVAQDARDILLQELNWAGHLQLSTVIAPEPQDTCANYANILSSVLALKRYTQIAIHLPITSYRDLMNAQRGVDETPTETPSGVADLMEEDNFNAPATPAVDNPARQIPASDPWLRWNRLRLLCHHSQYLGLALELTEDLPSEVELNRWSAEPVKLILIPPRIFQHTSLGPKLPPPHAAFFKRMLRSNVHFVIYGHSHAGDSLSIYREHLSFLAAAAPPLTAQEQYEQPYWDYLQAPLQPLMDNLESSTYETFERDAPKYKVYEDAMFLALQDKKAELVSAKTEAQVVLMVVGAGRGPIVDAAIRAERRAGLKVKLYALDKNPHALVTLRNRQRTNERWATVTIIHSDMREWNPPELADILVSELLGSFGDNELSPECLQGADRLLKPNGISIPTWYTSYLTPISSTKLHNAIVGTGSKASYETPHVVRIHSAFTFAEPKPVFTFAHPTPQAQQNNNNNRFITLRFQAPVTTLLHGLAGYFDCCLYKSVHVSIHPANHTPEMSSWFPIYFPMRNPILVHGGETIEISIWRFNNGKKVWYEWSIGTANVQSEIHNPNGRSYWIGL